ncbi:MAG: flagellar basal-body MS-ring/collar protein FliF [Gammaproteobacteria bacterium]|nr:flagellar basal-body MS-ring/collar protein FliF [Gammaproteobacteria bacterium]MDH5652943.1 flagellar basal-body MS-ring/collar protein FliF [Gammaproteobacteria bacterium]
MAEESKELTKSEQFAESLRGMAAMPITRQLVIMFGLALSIGLSVAIIMWSNEPDYSVLYTNLSPKDTSAIIEVFEAADLPYKVEPDSGMVLVLSDRLHHARMMLAEHNLPQDTSIGFELIEKEQGFGASNLIQNARYQRALEGELSRTIKTMAAVDNARVHLALPKESAFIRDERKPSASVMLNLISGARLEEEQIEAIRHLVASSVPKLDPKQVTVVDAKGRLLSDGLQPKGMKQKSLQFDYTRRIEALYTGRIEQLLGPIVGQEKIRAQVTADMDFTETELTQERFNPDLPAVRSEQSMEEQSRGQSDGGIPGALTNQPPGTATVPEQANDANQTTQSPSKTKRQSTRNYELDKTISYTRKNPGTIKRLSIAVVVDNKTGVNAEGEPISIPYTPEDLGRFTAIVKEAVGFNTVRGDTVNVTNVAFSPVPEAVLVDTPFWEKPWFWSAFKQIAVVMMLVFLMVGVLKPMMKNLIAKAKLDRELEAEEEELQKIDLDETPQLAPPIYQSNLQLAKAVAADDPKMVAQVVRSWIQGDKKRIASS